MRRVITLVALPLLLTLAALPQVGASHHCDTGIRIYSAGQLDAGHLNCCFCVRPFVGDADWSFLVGNEGTVAFTNTEDHPGLVGVTEIPGLLTGLGFDQTPITLRLYEDPIYQTEMLTFEGEGEVHITVFLPGETRTTVYHTLDAP